MPERDDEQSFQEAMRDVQPLVGKKGNKTHSGSHRKTNSDIPQSTLRARRKAAELDKPSSGAALSDAWIEPVDPEQFIEYSQPGIQTTRLRQLRQGTIPVQFQVDLHGYKIDEARDLIHEFIQVSRYRGLTCVRIIHGKSHRSKERQSTLKSHTNHWLKQIPDVLAFCSAPPSEGGTGSVLVLLKRK
ncbi:Smr/MutS family protein [Endozoicomonas sp. GU-1]|uniref:Smr/MutS family protein n=1 Tax=Endozoicomonas sp. GU-1 TaxID=3009078 RepID=UPI0022B41634|nr:Smr/MutS family protein [Endozoicomonas sp. GU-1]WBA83536.1 Smr/MutS family protein [Endozoicomonas sp. GU-1]WBA86470.1 Smr/MutS family protein [Endozoicomonas sp. GU-1]